MDVSFYFKVLDSYLVIAPEFQMMEEGRTLTRIVMCVCESFSFIFTIIISAFIFMYICYNKQKNISFVTEVNTDIQKNRLFSSLELAL